MNDDWKAGLPADRVAEVEGFRFAMQEIADTMVQMLVEKRASYGPHNLIRHGLHGMLVRSDDKAERLRQIYQGNIPRDTAVGESECDAWRDIAGYALLALLFLNSDDFTDFTGAIGTIPLPEGIGKPRATTAVARGVDATP